MPAILTDDVTPGPFTEEVQQILTIKNSNPNPVAFKVRRTSANIPPFRDANLYQVKTTAPKQYDCRLLASPVSRIALTRLIY